MVNKQTVVKWGFKDLGYELNDENKVTVIFYKTCREFCQDGLGCINNRGQAQKQSNLFVDGTSVVKNVNFQKHLSDSRLHQTAVLRLREQLHSEVEIGDVESPTTAASSSDGSQTTLIPFIQKMNANQKKQLCKKFQLAHFVAANGRSFKTYEALANFEKTIHQVDLGSAYLDDKAGAEITKFLSRSILYKNITEPLNSNLIHYYSIMFDGSSSAKTADEKALSPTT